MCSLQNRPTKPGGSADGPIRTMCLGQCHGAGGARQAGREGGRGGRREDVTEKRGSAGGKAWGQDGLAASGAGKFYTLSCFMVPFTGEQV